LVQLRRRKEWDLKFHKGKCIEIRHGQEYVHHADGRVEPLAYPALAVDVVHMVFKSFSSPYKYRDVVVLRACASIDKTKQEFDAAGYARRQSLASNTPPSSSGSDEGREVEEPIFRGEASVFQDGGMIFATRSVLHQGAPE
jgi:hypothetical protein